MLLLHSRDPGAKNGQRLMNSDRDTHLYSSFLNCTNMSFIQNCIKVLQFIFLHYIFSVFDVLIESSDLGAKNGQRLMNSERDTHLYSSFCTCTNASFRYISDSFIQNFIKLVEFRFQPLSIAVFRCSCRCRWP